MSLKKWMIATLTLLLIATLAIPAVFAEDAPIMQSQAQPQVTQPELTEDQTAELKAIYDKMWGLKKDLVNKYSEFGVMDKDQADNMIKQMDEKKSMMDEKGYMPWMRMGRKDGRRSGKMRKGHCFPNETTESTEFVPQSFQGI